VAPRLVPLADLAEHAVKMPGVLFFQIGGGEVRSTAEPGLRSLLDESPVGVDGGDAGARPMEDEAQAAGEAPPPLALQLTGERRVELAPHRGDVHSRLLEHPPPGQHPGPAAAPTGSVPPVLDEASGAVLRFQRRADLILQLLDVLGHAA